MTQYRYGLLGRQLAHSFSPTYFAEKFAALGLTNYSYDPFELPDIAQVRQELGGIPGLRGFNITIPYKQAILPYLDELTPLAAAAGAVNTVAIIGGRWVGYNTDVLGFEQSLNRFLAGAPCPNALILGTGGAAQAVAVALGERPELPNFLFISRRQGQGALAYAEIDEALLHHYPLLINTTPLGMYPDVLASPPIPYPLLTPHNLLFDLIYNPAETRFLAQGRERGCPTANGYDMLVLQAEAAWQIWQTLP